MMLETVSFLNPPKRECMRGVMNDEVYLCSELFLKTLDAAQMEGVAIPLIIQQLVLGHVEYQI